jgi:FtsH-binding integral membrane protein
MKQNLNLTKFSQYYQIYGTCGNDLHDIEVGRSLIELNRKLKNFQSVLSIISVQMLLSTMMCLVAIKTDWLSNFYSTTMTYLSFGLALVTLFIYCCVREICQKAFISYALLAVFTLCKSYLVSVFCISTSPEFILMTVMMTSAITVTLAYYAYNTKADVTVKNCIFFLISIAILLFTLFTFCSHNKLILVIFSCMGVILYSVYIVLDIQMMIADNSYTQEIDDYIYLTFMLYVDIIFFSVRILKLKSLEH